MRSITDMISDLIDSEKSITSPLLATKVLATKLRNNELLEWVNNELNGYSKDLPPYRRCVGAVTGNYINGTYQFNNQPFQTDLVPENVQDWFTYVDFYQGISTLESLERQSNSGRIEVPLSAQMIAMLEESIKIHGNPHLQILRATKWTSVNMITQILAIVRNKLLEFMLKLEDEFGDQAEIKDLQKSNGKIKTIMYQTIITNGNGNILNTGSNVDVSANVTVKKGEKDTIRQTLTDNGVTEKDLSDLMSIIDSDFPNQKTGIFGKKVNTWMANMIGKILDGKWQTNIAAAGSILDDAIRRYYGMK